jgi:hypothetical protein
MEHRAQRIHAPRGINGTPLCIIKSASSMGSPVAAHAVSAPRGRDAEFRRVLQRRGGTVHGLASRADALDLDDDDDVVVVVALLLMVLYAPCPDVACITFQGLGFRVQGSGFRV